MMVEHSGSYACPICMKDIPHHHDMGRKWIGVDFDGTLSRDKHYRDSPYQVGEPIPAMVSRVREWIAKGYTVKLLTARMNPVSHTGAIRDIQKMEVLLKAWCVEHLGVELECVMGKDGLMEVLWDDRAVQVIRDVGIPVQIFISTCICTRDRLRNNSDDVI